MKLYVDDIRDVPDESWTLCRTINEAINFIYMFGGEITEISLDHDISYDVRIEGVYRPFPSPETFKAVALYVGVAYGAAKYAMKHEQPKIIIHSANEVGAKEMQEVLKVCHLECELKPMGQAHRPK